MTAINIKWDIDMEEVYETLDCTTLKRAADVLKIPYERYLHMTEDERHSFAYNYFHHCPGALEDYLNIPNEIPLPYEFSSDEDISDWISDQYGYCHNGFELINNN